MSRPRWVRASRTAFYGWVAIVEFGIPAAAIAFCISTMFDFGWDWGLRKLAPWLVIMTGIGIWHAGDEWRKQREFIESLKAVATQHKQP